MRGIPHSFVVGRDNKIVYSGHPMEPGFEAAIKKAMDAYAGPPPTTATQPKDIPPPIKATREELMEMSVGELKSTSYWRKRHLSLASAAADRFPAALLHVADGIHRDPYGPAAAHLWPDREE